MRIAVSGSQSTGKSTIARTFTDVCANYSLVEEPYHLMVAEGFLFSYPPTFEDYEAQLQRSASLIVADSSPDVFFDRCPIDFLAYLDAVPGQSSGGIRNWFDLADESIRTLDLIVYVPVEKPDRIGVSSDEYQKLRRNVDRRLRAFLVDDQLGIVPNVIEVRGPVDERVRQVAGYVAERSS
jgi:hypothetical protein